MNAAISNRISPARRQLLEMCQKLNFGRIEQIPVRGGQPILDPPPAQVQEVKFASDNDPRCDLKRQDFLLKRQIQDFCVQLDRLRDGVIEYLEVKHGSPYRMMVRTNAGSKD